MWSTIERVLTVIFTGLFAYLKGRKDVNDAMNKDALDDAVKRKEVEVEIAKSYANPDARKRLRDKWTEKQ